MLIWLIMSGLSIVFFSYWVERSNWGRTSFSDSPVRDNSLPLWVPFFLFGMWVFTMLVFGKAMMLFTGVDDPEDPVVTQVALGASSVVTAFLGMTLAAAFFERGIKGFGLDIETVWRDLKRSVTVLLRTWPAVMAVMITIGYIVPFVTDGEMSVPEHPLLEFVNSSNSMLMIVFVGILVTFVAPALEEILFRGFVQTKLSDNLQTRWGAIFMTSAFFAIVHGGALWMHWPALFLFSCALGYVYEKSGSLFQSIFMHAIFNGSNLLLSFLTFEQV